MNPGIWSSIDDLTVYQDTWNLPTDVALTLQDDDVPRVFWRQSFFDYMMLPSGEGMYTKFRTNGSWQDDSDVLHGRVGSMLDAATGVHGMPLYAWVEKDGATYRLLLNLYRPSSGVPGPDVAGAFRLAAHPNPFHDEVTIRWFAPGTRSTSLDLLDVQGRIVTRLVRHGSLGGEETLHWSVGDLPDGNLPGGVYFLRLASDTGTQTTRLVRMAGR